MKLVSRITKRIRTITKRLWPPTTLMTYITVVVIVVAGAIAILVVHYYQNLSDSSVNRSAKTSAPGGVVATLSDNSTPVVPSNSSAPSPAPPVTTPQNNKSTPISSSTASDTATYKVTCINPMQDLTTTVSTTQVNANLSVQSAQNNYQVGSAYWIATYNNIEYMYDSTLEISWNNYIHGIALLQQTQPGCAAAASYTPYPYHDLVDASGSNYIPYVLGSARSQYP